MYSNINLTAFITFHNLFNKLKGFILWLKLINYRKKIQDYRKANNLNQDDLAAKLHIKRSTLSNIERGERKLSASELKEISEFFNISIDELLGIKKNPRFK